MQGIWLESSNVRFIQILNSKIDFGKVITTDSIKDTGPEPYIDDVESI